MFTRNGGQLANAVFKHDLQFKEMNGNKRD